jgi:hypothetical protein
MVTDELYSSMKGPAMKGPAMKGPAMKGPGDERARR